MTQPLSQVKRLGRRHFRQFWGGVAGWPRLAGRVYGSGSHFELQRPGNVPDFAADEWGYIHLTARREAEGS